MIAKMVEVAVTTGMVVSLAEETMITLHHETEVLSARREVT